MLALSSSSASSDSTGGLLVTVLARVAPWLRPEHAEAIHWLVRKAAHLTEYGILALLWRRALAGGAPLGAAAGWVALAISVACAALDEGRQARLPTRTGAVSDVLLDTVGAAAALTFARVGWWRVVDAATGVLLWIAAVGGVGALALALGAGAGGGVLWVSAPAAVVLLVYRRRSKGSRG